MNATPDAIHVPEAKGPATAMPSRFALAGDHLGELINYLLPRASEQFISIPDAEVQRILRLVQTTDHAADHLLMAMQRSKGGARRQFSDALRHGIEMVRDPLPEVTAFFETVDQVPPGLDIDKASLGAATLRRIDPLTLLGSGWAVSFFLGAILGNTAKALASNRRTIEMPGQRLMETMAYGTQVFAENGYSRFGMATQMACHLRIMHAALRWRLLTSGDWDEENFGKPASTMDNIGAAFSYTSWLAWAAEREGYQFSAEEREGIAHLSAYAAFRHGVSAADIPLGVDEQQKFTYVLLRTASAFSSPQETGEMIPPMVNIELPIVPAALRPAMAGVLNAYAHRILGSPLCNSLGIPNGHWKYVIQGWRIRSTLGGEARQRIPSLAWLDRKFSQFLHENVYEKFWKLPEDHSSHYQNIAKQG